MIYLITMKTNNFKTGKSNISIYVSNGVITKNIHSNNEYIKPLNYLMSKNLDFIPTYLSLNSNELKYKYIDGKIMKKVKKLSKKQIVQLAKMIKIISTNLQDLDNECYAHGDINPMNLIFDNKRNIISIIDWDSLHKTDYKNEDLFYTMWTCINIGNHKFAKTKINLIYMFLKTYDYKIKLPNDEIINNFYQIFEIKKNQTIQSNRQDKERIFNWINDSKKFIEKHLNKIKKIERNFYEGTISNN